MKVYVLRGSEDGIIGVYGSKKKAIGAAERYVKQTEEAIETTESPYIIRVSAIGNPRLFAEINIETVR